LFPACATGATAPHASINKQVDNVEARCRFRFMNIISNNLMRAV